MNKLPDPIIGAIYMIISACAYATQSILGKFAYESGLTPESLLILRYLFTAILITPYLLFRRISIIARSPLVIMQAVLWVVNGLCFFHALKYLSASVAVVVFFCHPVLVAITAAVTFKEKLTSRLIFGLVSAVTGVICISGLLGGVGVMSSLGLLFIIISALLYTIYSLISQRSVVMVSPMAITNSLAIVGVVILLLFYHDLGFVYSLTFQQGSIALAMAVLNTVLAVVFFLKGVQKIGAARATLLGTLEPVLAMVLAFFLLGETLTIIQVIGAVLIIFSMFMAVAAVPSPRLPRESNIEQ